LKEVVFKLGGIHIVICLQNDAFEGLIHTDTVGVDASEIIMKARYLGSINGVGSSCNEGGGARIVWLHPGCCGDDRVLHLCCNDSQMAVSSSTIHGRELDCVCIEEASCNLDVFKCRLMVYLWEKRSCKAVDDILNCECIEWRHVCCFVSLRGP
jgi:hypothetical protein